MCGAGTDLWLEHASFVARQQAEVGYSVVRGL